MADLIVNVCNKDKLGRWISITIGRENKLIELITTHRLVESAEEGATTTHAQHNDVMGAFNAAKHHRNQFLKDLQTCMRKSYEESKVKDVIIIGDTNINIEEKNIVQFMNENRLIDMHKYVNGMENDTIDSVFKCRSKCTDVVIRTHELVEFASGCQIVEYNEVTLNDHRGCMFDLEIE